MDAQELHIVLLSNDPMRTYPALSLALGAAAMGAKARIYCTTTGLDLVRKGAADNVRLPGFPPLGEVLRTFGITKETVEDGARMEDVIGFLSGALPAAKNGGVVTFI